jgi:hypothetical protein
MLIAKAVQQGVAVAVASTYPADEATAVKIVSEAYLRASALMEELRKKGYS